MNDSTLEIAERLRGLRDSLELTTKEMALRGSVSEEQYINYEEGKEDIPVSVMHQICKKSSVDISELLAGESQHNKSYTLTPSGKGITVKRMKEYEYQALAYNFKSRIAEPYLVTISPKSSPSVPTNSHEGQEFNYVIEGSVELMFGEKKILLNKGDSIYFDSKIPHGLRALGSSDVKLLAILM